LAVVEGLDVLERGDRVAGNVEELSQSGVVERQLGWPEARSEVGPDVDERRTSQSGEPSRPQRRIVSADYFEDEVPDREPGAMRSTFVWG
jgi:hypothetical protein